MTISALHQTSHDRLTVEFNDGSEIKSTLGVITDMMLYCGKDLDDSSIDKLKTASERSLALERSIEYVSRRPMSKKELHTKLLEKGMSEDTADYCSQKLEDLGIINDASYAASLARHYSAKGYGASKIKNEFYRHGISRELYEEALDCAYINKDKIRKIIESKLIDPSDRAQIKKVSDALLRRGFTFDEVKTALKNYTDELEEY